MRELPMLLNGDGVRATLDGRKTMTRRPVKPQPTGWAPEQGSDPALWYWCIEADQDYSEERRNPLGAPGDLLYVRETWCGHWGPILGGMRQPSRSLTDADIPQQNGTVSYATPDNPLHLYYRATWGDEPPLSHIKWCASIHMFKWAARTWACNTGVRVERVRDITYADILAEGLGEPPFVDEHEAYIAFAELWDSIYAKRGLGWGANPWVFVTSYEVMER